MLSFVNAIAKSSGSIYALCFAYLILEQKYVCSPTVESGETFGRCRVEKICLGTDIERLQQSYHIDTSYEYYLRNWVVDMDLQCTSITLISLMYSQYFIGMLIGQCLTFLTDRFGRKKTVVAGMMVD